MDTLYDRLKSYEASDYYGFHMPGHKRNKSFSGIADVCGIDITEIEGFDDLHHAHGILKDAQERAAAIYHAEETHFLINGSTAGILSAVLGVTKKGDRILVARNCHKSVYHAIYMNELDPVYLYPGFNEKLQLNTEISAREVRRALEEEPGICVVVIVSPTYDGVVSDVKAVADAAHEKGLPLIVDEAHGAHFGFHPYFPDNANKKGADIVVHSLHKTLPSLTQTALLHMNGTIVDRERVRRYLHMLQSSSPSYVLMAGIDSCIGLLDKKREDLFVPYVEMLEETRKKLAALRRLACVGPGAEAGRFDRSKIILSTGKADMDGRELYKALYAQYHLQMEMAAGSYVLAMTSPGDTEEGMMRLLHAAFEIDGEADRRMKARHGIIKEAQTMCFSSGRLPVLPKKYTGTKLEQELEKGRRQARFLPWEDSAGYISLEYAYLYPPGIPVVVPGEQMTKEAADLLAWYERKGCPVEGLKKQGRIEVLTDG